MRRQCDDLPPEVTQQQEKRAPEDLPGLFAEALMKTLGVQASLTGDCRSRWPQQTSGLHSCRITSLNLPVSLHTVPRFAKQLHIHSLFISCPQNWGGVIREEAQRPSGMWQRRGCNPKTPTARALPSPRLPRAGAGRCNGADRTGCGRKLPSS